MSAETSHAAGREPAGGRAERPLGTADRPGAAADRPLRAVIADDEPLSRERVRALLAREGDIEIVEECEHGLEAVEAIRSHHPDLLFLDIQMPGLDGFQVLEAVAADEMPVTVFVTAYDEHALRAFDASAVDYLLKPLEGDRFARAVRRARELLRNRAERPDLRRMLTLLDELGAAPQHLDRLAVRVGARLILVPTEDIDWIQGEGNYVRLHVGAESHLLRERMSDIEARLDPRGFVRIHRSTIVNARRVREAESLFRGEYVLVLHDGTKLTSSRSYRERVEALFGIRG